MKQDASSISSKSGRANNNNLNITIKWHILQKLYPVMKTSTSPTFKIYSSDSAFKLVDREYIDITKYIIRCFFLVKIRPILIEIWQAKGMWFKNLNFLQHLEHVDIIKFSNLLSALVSQDGLTIKGFFLKKKN